MNELLTIESLWKVYGTKADKTVALKDINAGVNDGEYLAIVGPSGAGKSTLLHIVGGLDAPTTGCVRFSGKPLSRYTDAEMCEWRNRNAGFVFQFYHLIEELSVLENVALPHLVAGGGRKTSFKKAQKLLQYLGIESKMHLVPSQLSGGERQKVAIARALINEPKILFCDEPTGNLDEVSAEKVITFLESLNRQTNTTLLIVTHNVELAKRAERILHLKGGELVSL